MAPPTVKYKGKTYVLVERGAYERIMGGAMPPLPRPDRNGNLPAAEYARASIAREIISRRLAAGLTQSDLARRAGVRIETLNRLERARHTPSVATIAKIDAALAKVERLPDRRHARSPSSPVAAAPRTRRA